MASLQTLERLHRASVRTGLGISKLLNHFEIEDVDNALDEE